MKKRDRLLGLAFSAVLCLQGLSAELAQPVPPVLAENQVVPADVLQTDGWIPAGPSLYPQLKADPRQPCFGVGYRWYDQALGSNTGMANLGGIIPIWRGSDVWRFDRIEIGLSGATWAVFDMKATSMDLINSDWYGAIPIQAEIGQTRLRLRVYHISSHLGDEYLQRQNTLATRKNPSYEAVDLAAYTPVYEDKLYAYGTIGHVIHSDSSYPLQHLYFEAGAEYYLRDMTFNCCSLSALPYAAVHGRFWEVNSFSPTYNAALGLAWSDKKLNRPQMATSLEYFKGDSVEGQFSRDHSDYVCIRLTYIP